MPEPSWTRMGTMSWDGTATISYAGDTLTMGKSDLYVEMYRVENDNQPGETNYACIPHLKQWPAVKLQDAVISAKNDYTKLIQNWSKNEYGGLEITDWGPTKERTGHLNWSLTLDSGSGGVSGGVTASYSTPYIKRKVTSEHNKTVAHEYDYPSSFDPFDPEGRGQIVAVENAGEAWLADSGGYLEDLLTVRGNSKFEWSGIEEWVGVEMEVDKLGLYL